MSLLNFIGVRANVSDRDPTSGFWYGPSGRRTTAGVDVNENTAMNYSAAWAATRLLCATGSCLPLNLRKRTGKQKTETAYDHAVQRILHNQFNPEMGSMMARAYGINMQVNWGNFYAEIVRERGSVGPIKELWPIHSSRMRPIRFDDGTLGYQARNDDGTTTEFLAREIFHVPSMITTNGITGKGVIQNARESIGAGLATEQHGAAFFGNGAVPGVIVKGGKFKNAEERAEYRRQWVEVHGGPRQAMKPVLLPEGADVSFMQFNARDSQFLELREHNINEFARWYGVPPHMIYDLRRATYTNIEAQGIEFVVYSLVPWLKLWEEEAWRKFLTPEEQKTHFIKHSVEGLLRGDSAARAAFYTALFNIGVLSINDILELEDRNGIGEDGDKRFVPLNMTTVQRAGTEPIEPVSSPSSTAAAALAEYVQPPPQVVAPDTSPLVSRCREVLGETLGRMLNKECRACKTAAENNKSPREFYSWLDEYYDRYGATLTDAVNKHVEIILMATSDSRLLDEVVTAAVSSHIAASKEDVLRATEVAANGWGMVPERITACGERWQKERLSLLGV
jgi:HK97 family phage portal protein